MCETEPVQKGANLGLLDAFALARAVGSCCADSVPQALQVLLLFAVSAVVLSGQLSHACRVSCDALWQEYNRSSRQHAVCVCAASMRTCPV